MKTLIAALATLSIPLSIFLSVTAASAETLVLPEAKISDATLGGEVLLIQMKSILSIDGHDNALLSLELGDVTKKSFLKQIVMNTSPSELRAQFSGLERPVTNAIIAEYEKLVSPSAAQVTHPN